MKSATKVTVQVEDYKGNMASVTGFKTLKRNNAGNLKGFVGSEMIQNFGDDNALKAAMWFLGTEDGAEAAAFCKENNLY